MPRHSITIRVINRTLAPSKRGKKTAKRNTTVCCRWEGVIIKLKRAERMDMKVRTIRERCQGEQNNEHGSEGQSVQLIHRNMSRQPGNIEGLGAQAAFRSVNKTKVNKED